jgi:arsenate reductase (thioredoxin)
MIRPPMEGMKSQLDPAIAPLLASAVERLAEQFEGIYDRETVKSVLDDSAEELSGGASSAFVPVLAERFARERLRAQAQAEGRLAKDMPEVVFVSLTGGGRAQIAAALLARATEGAVSVHTAGSAAADDEIDSNVRAAIEELGVDVSEAFSKPLSPEVLASADVVVTMGRSVGVVEIPEDVRHVDWRVGDPAGAPLDEVRRVIVDISTRVTTLAEELGKPAAG